MKKMAIIKSLIILYFMCMFSVNVTEAKVYIDIDSPALRQFPMAFYDFGDDKIGRELTTIVKDDLSFTNLFYFINKAAFIEDKGDDFNPANWTPIGAEAVLKGDITVTEKINVVMRLYDVVETRIILYKQYSSNKSDLRSIAHKISDDIYLALTGRKGIFGTKIAFVSLEEKSKELVLMDFDGGRIKRTKFRKQFKLGVVAVAPGHNYGTPGGAFDIGGIEIIAVSRATGDGHIGENDPVIHQHANADQPKLLSLVV